MHPCAILTHLILVSPKVPGVGCEFYRSSSVILGCAGSQGIVRNPVTSGIFFPGEDGTWGWSFSAATRLRRVTASKSDGVTGVSPDKEQDPALLQGAAPSGALNRSCAWLSLRSCNY